MKYLTLFFLDIHKASDIIFPDIQKVNHVKYYSVDGIVTDITCPDINVVAYVFIRFTLFILYYYLKKKLNYQTCQPGTNFYYD